VVVQKIIRQVCQAMIRSLYSSYRWRWRGRQSLILATWI